MNSEGDHDSIVELKVLMQTVLSRLTAVEIAIVTSRTEAATQVAALDNKWNKTYDSLEQRVRTLEDTRSTVWGGWKTLMYIGGVFLSLISAGISLFTHFFH